MSVKYVVAQLLFGWPSLLPLGISTPLLGKNCFPFHCDVLSGYAVGHIASN